MQSGEPRPGLARADRAPHRRFLAIARGLGVDDDATDAFLYAYQALPAADRRRLADAVAKDLEREGHDTGRAIAALFLSERDPAVLDHLWRALRTVPAAPTTLAFEAGTEDAGGVLLAFSENDALSALVVGWRGDDTTIVVTRVASSAEAIAKLRGLAGNSTARQSDTAAAIDVAAERLWRHRLRGGALPAGIVRFAPLFSA